VRSVVYFGRNVGRDKKVCVDVVQKADSLPVCRKPTLTNSGETLFYSGLSARWIFHKSSTSNASFYITFIY